MNFSFTSSYNRMLRIKNLRWEFGTVLPEEIKDNLCEQEVKLLLIDFDAFITTK